MLFPLVGASAQSWVQLTPTGQAPIISPKNAVYDAGGNHMIVFGGGFIPRNNLTTVLSNANGLGGTPAWIQLSPSGQLPPVRSHHTVVYDSANNILMTYGGFTGSGDGQPFVNDVWTLANANGQGGPGWSQLAPTGGPPTQRAEHTAVYDPTSNRMIVFGGCTGNGSSDCNTDLNDTWVLTYANGLGGIPQWIHLQPQGTLPSARNLHTAVYDSASNRMIVFGGLTGNGGGTVLSDVWVLTNANGLGATSQWIQLAPTGSIPARYSHTATYDAVSGSMTVFSGVINGSDTNDVWVLTNANGTGGAPAWNQLSPAGGPPLPRDSADAVYDPTTNRMTVFGGPLSDVWFLTNANGTVGSGLSLTQAQPNHGGNTGSVSVEIFGSGFVQGDQLSLGTGGVDIPAINVNVIGAGLISATFPLTGATAGPYDVIVAQSSGQRATLPRGFTVDQGGAPQVWVDIGPVPQEIAANHLVTIPILAGNSGNVDWNGYAFMGVQVSVGIDPVTMVFDGQVVGDFHPVSMPGGALVGTFVLPVLGASSGSTPYLVQFTAPESLVGQSIDIEVVPFNVPVVSLPSNYIAGQFIDDIVKLKEQEAGLNLPPLGDLFFEALERAMTNALLDRLVDLDVNLALCKSSEMHKQIVIDGIGAVRTLFQVDDGIYETFWNNLLAAGNGFFFDSALYGNYSLFQPPFSPYKLPVINRQIPDVASADPNDKVGPSGAGPQGYISGSRPTNYDLLFGNKDTASAPAQQVVITDQLDTTKFDVTNFAFGAMGFGTQVVSPPPHQTNFATTIDLRPATNLLVNLSAALAPKTGLATWTFTSIDPATGLPPTDPSIGFLPPGGDGYASFSVMPKQGLPTNAQIQNLATITFDENPPINTPTWLNTLDVDPPVSAVQALPPQETQPTFNVSWSGTDKGAGIGTYSIYVSDNGGAFTLWQQFPAATTSAAYTGQLNHTYGFYSIAQDLVGNVEPSKTTAEATTQVTGGDTTPPTITVAANPSQLWPPNGQMVPVTISGTMTDSQSGVNDSTAAFAVTDEYGLVQPSGPITVGTNGSYSFVISLQASRHGDDHDGRLYAIRVSVQDNAGNLGTATTTVVVPHDQGH